MNAFEQEILGVSTDQELRSIRDAVNVILRETGRLAGQFEEHVRNEEQWQERVERHLGESDDRIREVVAEAVGACRTERETVTDAAEEAAKEWKAEQLDRRAVEHWISDATKRAVILAVFGCLALATYLLITQHDNEAARITGLLAALTPFLLLLFRRQ